MIATELAEKYRPKTWEELIGQDAAQTSIRLLRPRGLTPRKFWISGPSGVGKTTLAYLLAHEVAEEFSIQEFDAGECTAASVRQLELDVRTYGWGAGKKTGRAIIINEAHGMRKDAVRQFLVMLERMPSHLLIVFTSSKEKTALFDDMEEAGPLLSRCIVLRLTSYGMAKPFAARAKMIAEAEGLDGKEIKQYEKLAEKHKNNLRAMLQEIEAGGMLETVKE